MPSSDNADDLIWLQTDTPFPSLDNAWGHDTGAPGLLAAGADLSVARLVAAYQSGIFPWFGHGDPPLWWSPDPRMVLNPHRFRLHRSLVQTIKRYRKEQRLVIRIDTAFETVVSNCANSPRGGRMVGTWIQPSMVEAYTELHRQGVAHSVECWIDGQLAGGLYLVSLGRAVFGESMFSKVSNGSKIALSALVAFCRVQGIDLIDCQQNTSHLSFMGAAEIPRDEFVMHLQRTSHLPALQWRFDEVYWTTLLDA
jgi:leucyl/phenylalanyl-tRNA--protein transferase